MYKIIKKSFERMQKGAVAILCIVFFMASSCVKSNSMSAGGEKQLSLTGTKWKLVGIVDVETGKLKALEPINCEFCYMLTFDNSFTDCSEESLSSFSTYSSRNKLGGCYEVDYETHSFKLFTFGGTRAGEIGDGYQYVNPFGKRQIQSFMLKKGELRLYYDENKNYLLFRQIQP